MARRLPFTSKDTRVSRSLGHSEVLWTRVDTFDPQITERSEVPDDEPIRVIPVWTIGDRLRKARELSDLDINDFAEQIGASASSVSAWERDLSRPRDFLDVIERWARISRVSPAWLMTGHDPTLPPAPERRTTTATSDVARLLR